MEQNRFRCHFSMLFKNMGGLLAFAALAVVNKMAEIMGGVGETEVKDGEVLLVVLVVVGLCLILFLYNLFIWKKTWIQIDGTSVVLERNTLHRKINTIGIQNISNVNLTQNLFQKLFGVYEVKLDTNSATTANETDVHIILGEKKAHWMRDEIIRRSGRGQTDESEMAASNEQTPEAEAAVCTRIEPKDKQIAGKISYSFKEVLLHCVYGGSVFSILFLIGILVILVLCVYNLISQNMLQEAVTELGGIFVLALGFLGGVVKMIQSVVRYYGFEVVRRGSELKVHYGLFQQKEYLIPVEKISAVRVRQSLFARIAGRKSLELICVGLGDDENEETAILLSQKDALFREQVQQILPEYARELDAKLMPQPVTAWAAGLPGMFWTLVFMGIVTGIVRAVIPESGWYAVIGGVTACVWYLICKGLEYSARRAAVGEDCVILVGGVFQLQMMLIPYDKIQYIEISQGLLARHFGLCKGEMYILASLVQSMHETGYFPEELLEEVHRKIL